MATTVKIDAMLRPIIQGGSKMSIQAIYGEGIRVPPTKVNTGIQAGNFIFTSGQSGRDHKTGIMPEGIRAQTLQALRNIQLILEAAGSKIEDLVAVSVYLVDLNEYKEYNEAYDEFFKDVAIPPTRTTYQVAALAVDIMRIEVKAIAYKG
ncbi:2-iminobutanoate/2-iminopropanoate deaminase [anaerobic digester metagenome]|uniref:2-iminobutanoate/2-iminopropanoate deaminase n=1 Tax=anaerobic digester metagenome TaxID=1263854 RepID=A0A485LXZ1_9ZZZZ